MMSVAAVDNLLDNHAIPVRKDDFVHAWLSPAARDSHARTDEQVQLLAALFSVLADAFKRSGLELNKPSALQRIDNIEVPDLGFWICRPTAKGPTYMLIVKRANETRAWQPELEQALAAE